MAKDNTFYFSHDYNCRADSKIKKLLVKHGVLGYGIYWSIIEDLYNNSNSLPYDIDMLSFDYRVDKEKIESVINDFGLFSKNEDYFYSDSVKKRLDARNEKSDKAKKSAKHRWGESESRIKANDCIFYILKVYNDNEKFIKIGVTKESVSRRYSGKLNGYEYQLLYQCDLTTEDALNLETLIKSKFKNYNPEIKFAGYLECLDIENASEIIKTSKDFAMQKENLRNAESGFRNAIKERKGKEIKGKEIIRGVSFSENKLEVIFEDGTSQKLGNNQLCYLGNNTLKPREVVKGLID